MGVLQSYRMPFAGTVGVPVSVGLVRLHRTSVMDAPGAGGLLDVSLEGLRGLVREEKGRSSSGGGDAARHRRHHSRGEGSTAFGGSRDASAAGGGSLPRGSDADRPASIDGEDSEGAAGVDRQSGWESDWSDNGGSASDRVFGSSASFDGAQSSSACGAAAAVSNAPARRSARGDLQQRHPQSQPPSGGGSGTGEAPFQQPAAHPADITAAALPSVPAAPSAGSPPARTQPEQQPRADGATSSTPADGAVPATPPLSPRRAALRARLDAHRAAAERAKAVAENQLLPGRATSPAAAGGGAAPMSAAAAAGQDPLAALPAVPPAPDFVESTPLALPSVPAAETAAEKRDRAGLEENVVASGEEEGPLDEAAPHGQPAPPERRALLGVTGTGSAADFPMMLASAAKALADTAPQGHLDLAARREGLGFRACVSQRTSGGAQFPLEVASAPPWTTPESGITLGDRAFALQVPGCSSCSSSATQACRPCALPSLTYWCEAPSTRHQFTSRGARGPSTTHLVSVCSTQGLASLFSSEAAALRRVCELAPFLTPILSPVAVRFAYRYDCSLICSSTRTSPLMTRGSRIRNPQDKLDEWRGSEAIAWAKADAALPPLSALQAVMRGGGSRAGQADSRARRPPLPPSRRGRHADAQAPTQPQQQHEPTSQAPAAKVDQTAVASVSTAARVIMPSPLPTAASLQLPVKV